MHVDILAMKYTDLSKVEKFTKPKDMSILWVSMFYRGYVQFNTFRLYIYGFRAASAEDF